MILAFNVEGEPFEFQMNIRGTDCIGSDLFSLLTNKRNRPDLETEVTLKYDNGDTEVKQLSELLMSNPLKQKGYFYWFDQGTWRLISQKTVAEKRKLIQFSRIVGDLNLPLFNLSLDKEMRAGKSIISENAYNRRIYEAFEPITDEDEMFLLDCKMIKAGDGQY